MKNPPKPRDKVSATCLVCGKVFVHGILDLKRHISAITLQHAISKKQSSLFQYSCPSKCGIYFKNKAHIELHVKQACSKKLSKKEMKALETSLNAVNDQLDIVDVIEEEQDCADDSSDTKSNSVHVNKKTTQECMVCGKLFLRGPIDLARHTNAITLKHFTSAKYTSGFPFGCKKCGLHFSSEDHLQLHIDQTTCNSDMIWPVNSRAVSGLRVITKAEYEKQVNAGVTANTTNISNIVVRLPDPSTSSGSISSNNKTLKPTKNKEITTSSGSKVNYDYSASDSCQSPRTKKAKIIVPDDRKSFFAVISLLIDAEKVPEGERLTESNYEQYIPEKHKTLVQTMKENLLYTCN